jgi:RNA polymerase sigma-70 factor, ECF subfamily
MDSLRANHLMQVVDPPAASLESRTDDELMELTCSGRHAAFQLLVRRHQARVLRVAARYLRDRTLASDVAQSAFLELYKNRERYQARGRFVPFLCRIAVNQCRMSARQAKLRASAGSELGVRDRAADDCTLREDRHDLAYALGQLSEKLRVVVVLRYGGDLDLAEIAEALELPLGSVKRRLFDAMAKLRELLEEPT